MKDFSVIIPTRGNVRGLRLCLGAFELFTAQKDLFEVVLVVDDDDDEDLAEYFNLTEEFAFPIKVNNVTRSDNFSRDYFNASIPMCDGKHIWALNDDAYVQVRGWDNIIRRAVERENMNGVYMVDIWDSTHEYEGESFPRFPMITRKAVDTLGFFFHPQVRMWPADKCVWLLYSSINAVIKCHDVKVQHDHIYVGDQSKSRMWRVYKEDIQSGVFPVKIGEQKVKLMEAINEQA